jgi:hypothetical protein
MLLSGIHFIYIIQNQDQDQDQAHIKIDIKWINKQIYTTEHLKWHTP